MSHNIIIVNVVYMLICNDMYVILYFVIVLYFYTTNRTILVKCRNLGTLFVGVTPCFDNESTHSIISHKKNQFTNKIIILFTIMYLSGFAASMLVIMQVHFDMNLHRSIKQYQHFIMHTNRV